MVYMNKFVVSVLAEGQIVKELDNNSAVLDYGSEYKIRLRNKNSRRAAAYIKIDGEPIGDQGFIVSGNSYVDLERPINSSNKFKFVSLESAEAQDFGKNGPNPNRTKGLIEVSWALEKEPLRVLPYVYPRPDPFAPEWPYGKRRIGGPRMSFLYNSDSHTIASGAGGSSVNTGSVNPNKAHCSSVMSTGNLSTALGFTDSSNTNIIQDGCTVEGSMSFQKFGQVYLDLEPVSAVTKLFLQGREPMFKTIKSTKYTEIPNNIIPSSAGSQLKTQAQKLKEEVAVLMKQENDLAEIQKLQHDKYVLEDSIKKRKEELGIK